MKLTIKTIQLQDMMARSVKGVGNNKLIPLTSLMAIELKDNVLTLITTDATNYLYIRKDKVEGENFYVVVEVDTFSKLVSKTTSENITLELKENMLEVKGNGTYSIELPLDEDGQAIKYPDPCKAAALSQLPNEIHRSTIQVILDSIKPSLATTLEVPCYTGYYAADSVIATDSSKIADMAVNLFGDQKYLISSELMDLLGVMTEERIIVSTDGDKIQFTTPDCIVFGHVMEGIEDFAIDTIKQFIDMEFSSMCAVPKSTLLQLLDRLSLFVGPFDENAVILTFTKQGIQVSSKASSGVEIIPYSVSENFKDFICMLDIQMFMTIVKAQSSDMIELWYGEDSAIKLVDGNVTQVLALLVDEE